MSLTVCTGWSLEGWHLYGRRFLESFTAFWPSSVRLEVCGERDAMAATTEHALALKEAGKLRHVVKFNPLDSIFGCAEFLYRNDTPAARGRLRVAGQNWKERAVSAGYNWRYDAWKFSRQGFIPHFVSESMLPRDGQYLCWLDGDVVTHAPIADESVITGLLPREAIRDGKLIAYLGREPKHPDIAFQLYRIESQTLEFLWEFRRFYETDEVFELKEWHSAYVWHHCLQLPKFRGLAHNLTPGGSGHVWHQSPLRLWGDHLKGERKQNGRSPERRL
jgi:hypothetical protein